jgi:mono/diheme cytochrome c family protein
MRSPITALTPAAGIRSILRLLPLAGWLLLVQAGDALARQNVKDAFLSVHPEAVGTQLDSLPGRGNHCGVCHYDFSGGGSRNPYGQALFQMGNLNKADGRIAAVNAVADLDSDGDGFTTRLEITAPGYGNVPTFPGLSSANVNLVSSIDPAEVIPYLTPTTVVDETPPSVTVLAPNGGELLVANQPATITWEASDPSGIASIRIHESIDGGATFSPVTLGTGNSGSYTWVPANRPTMAAVIRVVAVDGAANAASDDSDAFFTITSPEGGRVPTTLRDFDMPGSQPFEAGPEQASPENCATCHGNYNPAVEPYFTWQGSMMALASLDPLYEANLAIANQDAPDSGDLCLRCHIPSGWLQGRSVPTDGGAMLEHDKIGVSCDFCHRMVDPVYQEGISPARDLVVLGDLTLPGAEYGNGMYVLDPSAIQRGPYEDAAAPHLFTASPFHRSSAFCGTCHDVSNPAFNWSDTTGAYELNTLDSPNSNFSPHSMAPVERTYSEWLHSDYNSVDGVLAPQFAGNKWPPTVSSCQDCHMRDVEGYGARPSQGAPLRQDLPLHDMTGGSTWMPALMAEMFPGQVNAQAVAAGVERATFMLENAADLSAGQTVGNLVVRVTNQTGHKLPTGYPEGRRIWVNVRFFDEADTLLGESAAYDPETGVLTHDDRAKVYEVHPGIDENISEAVGLPVGKSFHFVLNNRIFKDNRIPPRGFTNAAYGLFGGQPVGRHYADYQHWDDTPYPVPSGAVRAEARLYYQSTSKEFIEFLRDENTTNSKGQELYDLWNENGKCPPTLMASASWPVLDAAGDADGDGLSNLEEAAFGSDPHSEASAHRPVVHELEVQGVRHLAMQYTRQQNLQGATITVEVSSDLATWLPAGETAVEHAVVDNGDGTESVMVRMVEPIPASGRQFMRLRVAAN